MQPSPAQVVSDLLKSHRSIRSFKDTPLDPATVEEVLSDAIAGTSSSGNLNTYSFVLTRDAERRKHLCKLHESQEMIEEAPLLITFCADTFRTREWFRQREARDNFNHFFGFMVSAFDAILVSQSAALGFESRGLGICYLGTTLNSCPEIADYLELPDTCIPVTSFVVGWPNETPVRRDRLPLAAYIHEETYKRQTPADIDSIYADREVKGWARYRAMGGEIAAEMERLGIRNLPQFYSSELKYSPDVLRKDGARLLELLAEKHFLER